MSSKFEKVKVVESKTLYSKHGRHVVVDVLEFADGSRHEWMYFKGLRAKSGAVAVTALRRRRNYTSKAVWASPGQGNL